MNSKESLSKLLLENGVDEGCVNALMDELRDYHCFLVEDVIRQIIKSEEHGNEEKRET